MSIVISSNLSLSGAESSLTLDHPVIGWQNLATVSNMTANISSDPNHPDDNLANPATHLYWSPIGPQGGYSYVGIDPLGTADDVDYVGIAGHNLGSIGSSVLVGWIDFLVSPPAFMPLVSEFMPGGDGPIIARWTAQSLPNIYIGFGPSSLTIKVATIYAGKLLVLPRKLYQGMGPINYGRVAKVTNGRSEAGNFLGRIVTQEFVKNSVPLSLIPPDYFRDHIADFLADSKENPFFFAWRPQSYPDEVGYCHMTNDPFPTNEPPHGLISMTMEMTGIVK